MDITWKTATFVLVMTVIVLGTMLVHEKIAFPVDFVFCDITYSDCDTLAKYEDMDSCDSAREKGEWYCDTITNPLKPDCHVGKSEIAVSYCSY